MKDIELIPSEDVFYDWHFDGADLCTVNGDLAIRNCVIHLLKLKPYELQQEVYRDRGSIVNDMVGAKPSENMVEMIQEAVATSVSGLDGVSDCIVEVELLDGQYMIRKLVAITDDGREVLIHGV